MQHPLSVDSGGRPSQEPGPWGIRGQKPDIDHEDQGHYVARILQQLHDGPLQCVAAAQLALQAGNIEFANEVLTNAAEQLRSTVVSGHSLLVDIEDLISGTTKMFHSASETKTEVHGPSTLFFNHETKSELVSRTVRECLVNALKHQNTDVEVQVQVNQQQTQISVISTLKPEKRRSNSVSGAGFGIRSLNRQAAAVGGTFSAGRLENQWIAKLTVPR